MLAAASCSHLSWYRAACSTMYMILNPAMRLLALAAGLSVILGVTPFAACLLVVYTGVGYICTDRSAFLAINRPNCMLLAL